MHWLQGVTPGVWDTRARKLYFVAAFAVRNGAVLAWCALLWPNIANANAEGARSTRLASFL